MVWFFISFVHCPLRKFSVQKKLRPLKYFGRKGSVNELLYSIKPGILNLSRTCPISCILPGKKPLQTLEQENENAQMWGVWMLHPYITAKQRAYLRTSRMRQLQQKLGIVGYEDWLCPRHRGRLLRNWNYEQIAGESFFIPSPGLKQGNPNPNPPKLNP